MAASMPPMHASAGPVLQGEGPAASSSSGSPGETTPMWQLQILMDRLRTRSSQMKSWQEHAKASRTAMMERRGPPDPVEKAQIQKCLDNLQKSIKVNTLPAMGERLEKITRQLGLKFHVGRTGSDGMDFFISSDMFYVEMFLSQSGEASRVRVQHNTDTEPKNVPELADVLKVGNFQDFAAHLEGLDAIYKISTDNKTRAMAWVCLSALESDLSTLAMMQDALIPDTFNLVHKTPVGILTPRRGGKPLEMTYFISPYELLDERTGAPTTLTVEIVKEKAIGQRGYISLQSAAGLHKLQTTSLISMAQKRDATSATPFSFIEHSSSNSSSLPAVFAFVLRASMPLTCGALREIRLVTDVSPECFMLKRRMASGGAKSTASSRKTDGKDAEMDGDEDSDDVQLHPFVNLLVQTASGGKVDFSDGALERMPFYVTLPDQQHRYHFANLSSPDEVATFWPTEEVRPKKSSAEPSLPSTEPMSLDVLSRGSRSAPKSSIGALVSKIGFTHPTHLPRILNILRGQSVLNTLLASCVRPQARQDSESATCFEVELPSDSWQRIWVRFEHPLNQSLVTAEFDTSDVSNLKCSLHYDETVLTEEEQSLCSEEYASKVIQKTFSIPVTMRAILKKLNAGRKKQLDEQPKPAVGTLAGHLQQPQGGPKKTGAELTSEIHGKLGMSSGMAGGAPVQGVSAKPDGGIFLGPGLATKTPVVRLSKHPLPSTSSAMKVSDTVSTLLQSGGHVTVKPGPTAVRKTVSDGGFQPPTHLHPKLQGQPGLMQLFGAAFAAAGQPSRRGRKRKITAPATPSPTSSTVPGPPRSVGKRFGLPDDAEEFFEGTMSAPASVDGSSPASSDDGSMGSGKLPRNLLAEHLKIFQGPLKNDVSIRPLTNEMDHLEDDEDVEDEEESIAAISAALLGKPPAAKKPKQSQAFSALQRSLSSSSETSSMLLHLSEKTALSITPVSSSHSSLLPPNVTITASSSSSSMSADSANPLARFGLERRPGIEIIPISSSGPKPEEIADKEEKKVKLRDVRKESIGMGPLSADKKAEKERKKRKREKDELEALASAFPTAKLGKFSGAMGPPFSAATKPVNFQTVAAASAKPERGPITLNIKQGSSSFKRSASENAIKLSVGKGGRETPTSGANSPTFVKAASISPAAKHLLPQGNTGRVGSPSPKPPSSPKTKEVREGGIGGPPGLNPLFGLPAGAVPGGPPTSGPSSSMASYKIPKLKDRKPQQPSGPSSTADKRNTPSPLLNLSTGLVPPVSLSPSFGSGPVEMPESITVGSTTITPAQNPATAAAAAAATVPLAAGSPPLGASGSGLFGGGKNIASKGRKLGCLSAVIDKLRSSAEHSDGTIITAAPLSSTPPPSTSSFLASILDESSKDSGTKPASVSSLDAGNGDEKTSAAHTPATSDGEATNHQSSPSSATETSNDTTEFSVKPSTMQNNGSGLKLTVTLKNRASESPTSFKISKDVSSPAARFSGNISDDSQTSRGLSKPPSPSPAVVSMEDDDIMVLPDEIPPVRRLELPREPSPPVAASSPSPAVASRPPPLVPLTKDFFSHVRAVSETSSKPPSPLPPPPTPPARFLRQSSTEGLDPPAMDAEEASSSEEKRISPQEELSNQGPSSAVDVTEEMFRDVESRMEFLLNAAGGLDATQDNSNHSKVDEEPAPSSTAPEPPLIDDDVVFGDEHRQPCIDDVLAVTLDEITASSDDKPRELIAEMSAVADLPDVGGLDDEVKEIVEGNLLEPAQVAEGGDDANLNESSDSIVLVEPS